MSLKEKLQNDLTGAMRARDELRSSTIRMILTAIKNEEVSGKEARELSDAEVITVLSREAKKRREAAEAFEQAGANDRAATERAEGVVISEYLPQQLTEAELKQGRNRRNRRKRPCWNGIGNESAPAKDCWTCRWWNSFWSSQSSTFRRQLMKFEYATVPLLTHATKQILDTWGSDGWELVQVVPAPGGGDQLVAYMKRALA